MDNHLRRLIDGAFTSAAAQLDVEAELGPLLWEMPDGTRCHTRQATDRLTFTIRRPGQMIVQHDIGGVDLDALR